MKLDSVDRKIINELQQFGRKSASHIAEKIKVSIPTITERIKKLQETGVIVGFQAVLDPTKMGLDVAAIITIIPLVVIGGTAGMILFGASVGVTLFLIGLSTRSFGGITGDVLGAANELTRLSSLLIFVSL